MDILRRNRRVVLRRPLTEASYRRVEDAYVAAAKSYMREAGVTSLVVAGLENHKEARLVFGEGSALDLEAVGRVLRRLLRGDCWCRLEAAGGFVHIGWDYYMYVGVWRPCPSAEAEARRLGLFIEPFLSPYREWTDASQGAVFGEMQ